MKKNIILYVVAGAVVLAGLVTGGVIVGKKVLNKAEGTTEAVTQAFNQEANRWDYLGAFLGNRQFLNWDGDRWQINSDYKGMNRMTARKEVAAV